MSLLKWIMVEKPVLPSSSTRAYSSLSKKDLENSNKEVKHTLEVGENGNTLELHHALLHFAHALAIGRSPN